MGKTGAERLRESLEGKKQKKREYNARFYLKNKDKILDDRKEKRRKKRPRIVVEQERERKAPKPNWRLCSKTESEKEGRKRNNSIYKCSRFTQCCPRSIVTIGFALPATNRGIERKENSGDLGVRTTKGKTNSQLAWQAGKELVTIPRYRICYNWKQYRTQAWTSTV